MNMKKTIRLIIALCIVLIATSACKTKQKVAAIPGANIPAKATVVEKPKVVETVVPEPEVVQKDKYTLIDGSSDTFKSKYHVVVGSFEQKEKALGLQSILKKEGNNALVVVNEKGMYRVLIASFNDYNQAHAKIKDINTRFPGSWVLIQK